MPRVVHPAAEGRLRASPGGVLHLPVRIVREEDGSAAPDAGEALYGEIVRRLQAARDGDGAPAPAATGAATDAAETRRAYFTAAGPPRPAVSANPRQG